MGTYKTNLEKYLELWELFEKEIQINDKLDSKTLSGFAKYYEKYSSSDEKNDYKRVLGRLKKMKQRKNQLKKVRENTLLELENFYKLLREDYFSQELLRDEHSEYWFN
ncbi:hypothetical protein [Sulfurimonas sp.]|uniref:hypothetical protein n=1 Tax=Sulfurimonas sp. TaxID=2022749 RepID=UPI00286E8395|nr:hypothetical protein [Sulfurimonas sp.]